MTANKFGKHNFIKSYLALWKIEFPLSLKPFILKILLESTMIKHSASPQGLCDSMPPGFL